MFLRARESISIQRRANIARWTFGKRAFLEQRGDSRFAVQQGDHGLHKPWILAIRAEGGKPHLPIESQLMWRAPTGRALHPAGFPFEFVRLPIDPVGASFNNDLYRGHADRQSIDEFAAMVCDRRTFSSENCVIDQ